MAMPAAAELTPLPDALPNVFAMADEEAEFPGSARAAAKGT